MDFFGAWQANVNMAPVKKTHLPLGRTFLREWREFAGLSQEQAAEAIDASRELISKMENGASAYTQRNLERLASAYGCLPGHLLLIDPSDDTLPWRYLAAAADAPDMKRAQIASFIKFTLEISE